VLSFFLKKSNNPILFDVQMCKYADVRIN